MSNSTTTQGGRANDFSIMAMTIPSVLASVVSKTASAPLERLKLIQQTLPISKLAPEEKRKFASVLRLSKRIYKEEGLISFWRGNFINVLRTVPNGFLQFMTYDFFKTWCLPKGEIAYEGFNLAWRKLLAAYTSGLLITTCTYPMDVIRVRFATDLTTKYNPKIYTSIFDATKKMVKNEGIWSLYKGYWISFLGIFPYMALSFLFYDEMRKFFIQSSEDKKNQSPILSLIDNIGLGTLSGSLAMIITYPLDTLRRRMQVNGGVGYQKLYKNTSECFRLICKTEGFGKLYAGIGPAILKVLPAAGLYVKVYGTTRSMIEE